MGKKTKASTAVETAIASRRQSTHKAWCKRHPQAAAQERAIRLRLHKQSDQFGHKQGTAATHAAALQRREGALARLYMSGAIDIDELGAAEEIAAAAELLSADVRVRTMSLETRIDHGGRGDGAFWEALGQVRREMAYRAWRVELGSAAAIIEDIVLRDIGLVEAASMHRVGVRRLRKLLVEALALWTRLARETAKQVGEEELAAMHAAVA